MARPRTFDTAEELHEAVDRYFESVPKSEHTITGIALFLGFESRQSFYDYEKNEAFSYIIKRARLSIEHAYELRLNGNSCTGAIFALKNMGWKDEKQVEHSGNLTWNETKNYGADNKTNEGS